MEIILCFVALWFLLYSYIYVANFKIFNQVKDQVVNTIIYLFFISEFDLLMQGYALYTIVSSF